MIAALSLLDFSIAAALLLSLGASITSVARTGCKACSKVALLVGGLPVGAAGVAGYGALLALFLWRPDGLPASFGLAFAAGAHVALLRILHRGRAVCWPCLATAAGAFLASAFALAAGYLALWQLGVLAAAAIGTELATRKWAARYRIRSMLRAKWVGRELADAHLEQLLDAPLTLTIMVRPECEPCQTFKERDLSIILEHYGSKVVTREYQVEEDQFLAPAVVALTEGAPMVFPTFFCTQKDVLDQTDRVVQTGLREYAEAERAAGQTQTVTARRALATAVAG